MRVHPMKVFVYPTYCSSGLWTEGGAHIEAREVALVVPPLLLQYLWCWHAVWEATNGIEGGGSFGQIWYANGQNLVDHMNACQNEIHFVYKADMPD